MEIYGIHGIRGETGIHTAVRRGGSGETSGASGAPPTGENRGAMRGGVDRVELSAAAVRAQISVPDGEKKGAVTINVAKRARMLAAAKTKAQLRALIAALQQDLRECESGEAQGLEVDAAAVSQARALLAQAQERMGSAEDREAMPGDETAFALAALF